MGKHKMPKTIFVGPSGAKGKVRHELHHLLQCGTSLDGTPLYMVFADGVAIHGDATIAPVYVANVQDIEKYGYPCRTID